jgi:hypothetical protein
MGKGVCVTRRKTAAAVFFTAAVFVFYGTFCGKIRKAANRRTNEYNDD